MSRPEGVLAGKNVPMPGREDRSDAQRRLDRLRGQVGRDLERMSVESEVAPHLEAAARYLDAARRAVEVQMWPEVVDALAAAAAAAQRAGGTQTLGVPAWPYGEWTPSGLSIGGVVDDLLRRAQTSLRRRQLTNVVGCISDASWSILGQCAEQRE